MKRIWLLIPLSLSGLFSFAQPRDKAAFQSIIDPVLSRQFTASTPGISVLIARKGEIMYENAFGSADLELNVLIKPAMVFRLASITKQFTAAAILQLVEKGKLLLEDSLQKFLPEFPAKGKTITIENLLTHTSGIKDLLQIDYGRPFLERFDFSPAEMIDLFKALPLEFDPGTQYKYSNSGYVLLGAIIERVSGQSYEKYVETNIIAPLQLNQTYFDAPNKLIPGRVKGYQGQPGDIQAADFWSPTIAYAAGGLLSTVGDLFKWHQALFSYKVISKAMLEKSFTRFKLKNGTEIDYGYGWMLNKVAGFRTIEHSGSISGFLTNEVYYPDQDIFIVVLCNSNNAPRDQLSIQLSELAMGVSFQKEEKIEGQLLDKFIGRYFLAIDSARQMDIAKEGDHLVAHVRGETDYQLLFQSAIDFQFKSIVNAKCRFNIKDGVVAGFTVTQGANYEWIRSNSK